jgi:hypothetical protein
MTIKYSENKIFAVDTNDDKCIYILKSEVENQLKTNKFIIKHLDDKRGKHPKLKDYKKYTTNINLKKLGNDCLMLTEALIKQNLSKLDTKKAQLRAQDDNTKRLFGHSDQTNVSIATKIIAKRNDKYFTSLSPNINQGYSIIKREVSDEDENCPYHAAAVIFKDGKSTVTLEADAGDKELDKPIFDLYSPIEGKGLKSFYNTYKDDYTYKGKIPASSILIPR